MVFPHRRLTNPSKAETLSDSSLSPGGSLTCAVPGGARLCKHTTPAQAKGPLLTPTLPAGPGLCTAPGTGSQGLNCKPSEPRVPAPAALPPQPPGALWKLPPASLPACPVTPMALGKDRDARHRGGADPDAALTFCHCLALRTCG